MNPAIPAPISSSASSTLTAAMMPSMTFVVPRLPSIRDSSLSSRLRGPATAGGAPRDVVQRPPALVGCRPGLFHRPAHPRDLADEVIQLRLDLVPDAAAVLGQIEPSPDTADDGAQEGRHEHSRSLVH